MFINYLCSCSVDTCGSSCNCCNLCTLIFLIGLFLIILIFGSIILHFVLNKNKDKNSSNKIENNTESNSLGNSSIFTSATKKENEEPIVTNNNECEH